MQIQGNTVQERFLSAVNSLNLDFPVADIARKMKKSQSTVSPYLKEDGKVASKFLRSFCEAFGFDFDEINGSKMSPGIKKKWELEAEIISLRAENKSLLLNLSKWMAKLDPSKKAHEHYEYLVSDKKHFEQDLINNLK